MSNCEKWEWNIENLEYENSLVNRVYHYYTKSAKTYFHFQGPAKSNHENENTLYLTAGIFVSKLFIYYWYITEFQESNRVDAPQAKKILPPPTP